MGANLREHGQDLSGQAMTGKKIKKAHGEWHLGKAGTTVGQKAGRRPLSGERFDDHHDWATNAV